MPNIRQNLRYAIENAVEKDAELAVVLDGYKQYLYLQKSENTSSYWKVVIGIWTNRFECENGFEPYAIIRITTDDFCRLVPDKHTGKLYESLSTTVFSNRNIRMFY